MNSLFLTVTSVSGDGGKEQHYNRRVMQSVKIFFSLKTGPQDGNVISMQEHT
jgi:hypothetical protein